MAESRLLPSEPGGSGTRQHGRIDWGLEQGELAEDALEIEAVANLE
jgi:hypothetical protein